MKFTIKCHSEMTVEQIEDTDRDIPFLLKIPKDLLEGDSKAKCQNLTTLMEIVNKGYNMPRFKYNIIQSPRVRSPESFLQDLGLVAKGSVLYLLIGLNAFIAEQNKAKWWDTSTVKDIQMVVCDEKFEYTSEMVNRTIGTIAIKPKEEPQDTDSLIITAFTSHYPYTGSLMLELLLRDLQGAGGVKRLVAVVIVEHDLVGYYAKLGFVKDKTELVKVANDSGVDSKDLEKGLVASRDFHLATMHRDVSWPAQ